MQGLSPDLFRKGSPRKRNQAEAADLCLDSSDQRPWFGARNLIMCSRRRQDMIEAEQHLVRVLSGEQLQIGSSIIMPSNAGSTPSGVSAITVA